MPFCKKKNFLRNYQTPARSFRPILSPFFPRSLLGKTSVGKPRPLSPSPWENLSPVPSPKRGGGRNRRLSPFVPPSFSGGGTKTKSPLLFRRGGSVHVTVKTVLSQEMSGRVLPSAASQFFRTRSRITLSFSSPVSDSSAIYWLSPLRV